MVRAAAAQRQRIFTYAMADESEFAAKRRPVTPALPVEAPQVPAAPRAFLDRLPSVQEEYEDSEDSDYDGLSDFSEASDFDPEGLLPVVVEPFLPLVLDLPAPPRALLELYYHLDLARTKKRH